MKKKRLLLILAVMLFAFVFGEGIQAMESDNYAVNWMVPLTNGGGIKSASTNYSAHLTIGQTVAVGSSSANYTAGTGFWYGLYNESYIYIPLVPNSPP